MTMRLPRRLRRGGSSRVEDATRPQPTLTSWISTSDNPALAHQAVLQLTYGISLAVVVMSVIARLLGLPVPIWLISLLGAIMAAAANRQERLLRRGRFAPWMPAVHLNLGLMLLTIWIVFSGGAQSPFVWIHGVAVAIYGVLWGRRWAIATATLCSAYLLLAVALSEWMGISAAHMLDPLVPLRASLVSYMAMFFLVAIVSAKLREQVQEIFRESKTDPLTGLANRRALREAIDAEVTQAVAAGTPCVVIELEIDHFKQVNDRFGHLEGDAVLRRLAETLRQTCRATDFLARFGGDEFVAIMPQTTSDEGLQVVDRIRQSVAEDLLLQRRGVTISVGLAAFPDHAQMPHELLEAADHAMYLVKSHGGNRVGLAS